jgi:hypothetical protein
VLSPEIEDRNVVEVGNWAKHKKSFYKMNEDLLSIIILNLAFDEMLRGGSVVGREKVWSLAFANDLVVVAKSEREMKEMMRSLGKYVR